MLQRGKQLAISVFETKYSIVPEKVEHLRILAETAHIKLGLFIAEFPPNPEHVRLAELLVERGFHTGTTYVFGSALLPLGSTTRLPRTPNAPPDTETTGRALPMLLGQLNPLRKGALGRAQRHLENLTIDAVRRSILQREHMRAEIEVCLVWMHRLLGGNPCSPTDQKYAMMLLSSRFNLVEPTVATFGFKFLFFKLHGNQAVRLMRVLRDCAYLSLLTDADRGRMLLFLLQLRVSAATQEP